MTYYTSPSGGKSGIALDAYRKHIPPNIVDPAGQLNIDESSILDASGSGLNSTTMLNAVSRGNSNTQSRRNFNVSGNPRLAVNTNRNTKERPMTAGQRNSFGHNRFI